MTNFDFIASKEFRESLESDFRELNKCIESKSWKSVQVLAGSIVESLLIDYLSATAGQNANRKQKDPLKLELAEAITICRDEKVLSERAADLCSVIRSYRNLIHPGRMVRLGEPAPNSATATVALALIEIITEDLAQKLRASVGLTSEQILSKITKDPSSISILKHLLAEVSERQKEQLLLELIPMAHQNALTSMPAETADKEIDLRLLAERLEKAYRIILETVTTESRKRVALEFVRVLREGDGDTVSQYRDAFFRPSDLEFLASHNAAMVREHIIGNAPAAHTRETLKRVKGIAPHLEKTNVPDWIDPYISSIVSSTMPSRNRLAARTQLIEEILKAPSSITDEISERIQEWIEYFAEKTEEDKQEILKELKNEINMRIPF